MKKGVKIMIGALLLGCVAGCKPGDNKDEQNQMEPSKRLILLVGTYTGGSGSSKSQGIYVFEVNFDSMKFVQLQAQAASNPSYLCVHWTRKLVFCVNENQNGQVSAFRIDTLNFQLTPINSVSSRGSYPCYVSVDKSGKYVLVANYGSGNYAMFGIKPDGGLTDALSVVQDKGRGPNASRQEGPHAHMIDTDPFSGRVYATDLGTDQVHLFGIDSAQNSLNGPLFNYSTAAGAGPRHLTIHPLQRWMYIITELTGTIEAVSIDSQTGSLTKFQTISTLEAGEKRYPGSADIHITPNGRFLYATNRGEINNIACFSIDSQTGMLSLLGHVASGGKTPRNFVIDPSGQYLLVAHQDSNTIVVFSIQTDGTLQKVASFSVPMPVCLKFI